MELKTPQMIDQWNRLQEKYFQGAGKMQKDNGDLLW